MSIAQHPIRKLQRTRHIGATFVRHGFGFAWEQLQPNLLSRLRRRPQPADTVSAEAAAEHFRLALEELGPTFVKLGQVLSTRPDLLPPAYIAELTRLQDQVPAQPWDEIHAVLTHAYGKPPEEVFATIDPTPLAAASLAQVHAATLTDGAEVVVKVQRQGIRQLIETDLAMLTELAAGSKLTPLGQRHDLPGVVREFADTLRAEMDYRREGRSADRLRKNFEGWTEVHFPRVYWEYSTPQVLVMERIRGIKIDDLAALEAAGVDRKGVARYAAQTIVKEMLEDGFFHADPHPGNFVVMSGNVLGVMDFGMMGVVDEKLRQELTLLYIAAVEMSTTDMVEQLLRMGAVEEDVDRPALARDVGALLDKYRGITLKEVRAAEFVADLMPIAFRHRLHLPSNLWLLGKTLSMLEGVGAQLDPDFDIFAASGPLIRRLIRRSFLPKRPLRLTLLHRQTEMVEMMDALPRVAGGLLRKAERGDLFTVRMKDTADILKTVDRLSTRLAVSLMIAALIIGTAWLFPYTAESPLARWLSLSGFAFSTLMGAVLILSMVWPRRPRR